MSSSYEDVVDGDIVTPEQFKESMRLVRLQIAIPISGEFSAPTEASNAHPL